MKAKLTKRTVEAISPAGGDGLIWDTEIPGFGVKVTPRGARIYVLQYSRGDSRRFIQDVAAGKTRRDQKTVERGRCIVRGGRVPANRCLTLLGKMFGLAEDWGYRPDGSNPCRMVERFAEAKRERFLSGDELRRLGDALAALEMANPYYRIAAIIIRLLLLTGARSSEIVGLRYEDIDLARGL